MADIDPQIRPIRIDRKRLIEGGAGHREVPLTHFEPAEHAIAMQGRCSREATRLQPVPRGDEIVLEQRRFAQIGCHILGRARSAQASPQLFLGCNTVSTGERLPRLVERGLWRCGLLAPTQRSENADRAQSGQDPADDIRAGDHTA